MTNFVTDVPVQGPTDEGIRGDDCYYVNHMLPTRPDCVDCEGKVPMWAQQNRLSVFGMGEGVMFNGRAVRGFALEAAGDPEVFSKFSPAQQQWIATTLATLNANIVKATGTTCPTWAPAIDRASGCFQAWFNANYGGQTIPGLKMPLRTDGVFDQDTFYALAKTASDRPTDFPTPFPGAQTQTFTGEKKLSTGAMVGIGLAGATVVGGVIYAATRGKGRRRRRR